MRVGVRGLLVALIFALAGCTGADPSSTSTPPPSSAAPATVTEQTGSIEGLVLNEEDLPLAGAEVGLQEPSMVASTDASGKFTFNELAPGDYKVFASKLGYQSTAKSAQVVAGEVASVQFQLKAIALENQSFHVTLTFEGYMECSVSAFSPVNPCTGVTGSGETSWIVDVDRTYPLKEAVVELAWVQASPVTGNEMEIEFCDDIENRDVLCLSGQTDGWYTYADGTSPVTLRVSDMPKEAEQLLVGAGAKFGAQPVVQQRFTEYLTWCYVEKCADDFSALPPAG